MKNILQIGSIIIISFILTILLSNFIYLAGYIDFYKAELLTYNSTIDLSEHNEKNTILIMGDSFTAANSSYPNILRNILHDYRIINSGISGSGIIQASIIAKKRIHKFKPDIFIYQIYVGNDLVDITYPTNWKRISFMRNIYWFASNHIRVISYLNYKLAQLTTPNESYHKYTLNKYYKSEIFSVDKFTKRERIYNIADDKLVENSILLKGSRKNDFKLLSSKLAKIFKLSPVYCKNYILVIPHASQINSVYLNRTIKIGAKFSERDKLFEEEYPFIKKINELFPETIVLNPLVLFRNAEANGVKVYFANDGHLNNNGQKILADFIAKYATPPMSI